MKKYLAEFLGTFFLVFIGTGSVAFSGNIIVIALAFGLALMAGIYSVGQISGGHFNPAVTFAMWIDGQIDAKDGLFYVISQFLGAIVGSAFIKAIWAFVTQKGVKEGFGDNSTAMLGIGGSIILEVVMTFVFLMVILTVTSNKFSQGPAAGLIISLTLSGLILFGLNLTGVSLNPARSFGPALFAGGQSLLTVWVFILAPLVGAGIAAITYRFLSSDN